MILDARTLAPNAQLETDVCIVGGGTAGLTLAREFIGHGRQVCVLESGGREPEPETQSLAFGENLGFPYYPLDTTRARLLGGTSSRWHVPAAGNRLGARLRPLDPIDFEKRDWVPYSGWPFDKAHLDPYFDRAQAVCRIEPPSFEIGDWEDAQTRPRIPLIGDEVQSIIYKIGCRDPFVLDYPKEVGDAENITTWLHANVLEIETNPSADQVTGLLVATTDGKRFSVKARLFVLATGGIEIPRLLLLSNRIQTCGLANQNDLVGRFFMEHPHFWSGVFTPANPDFVRSTALYNDFHTVKGIAIIGKLALGESVMRREKLLNQNIQLIPWMPSKPGDPLAFWGQSEPRSAAVQSFNALCSRLMHGTKVDNVGAELKNIAGGLNDVVAVTARKLRNKLTGATRPTMFVFSNMTEQVPNPDSRVTLGTECDLFGQRRVQLDWRIVSQDIRSARRTQEIIGGALERAGLGRFSQKLRDDAPPANTEGGYHHMGTTRMHEDPKQGVVDANSRVHGMANLFIAGPSVFPTGGYANPVLTMVALTLRLADYLKQRTT